MHGSQIIQWFLRHDTKNTKNKRKIKRLIRLNQNEKLLC